MAENVPHGNQVAAGAAASDDDGHSAPPTAAAFPQLTRAAAAGGGSSAGNMGENLIIPDLNMEEERDSADDGGSKDDKPRSEVEDVEVPAAESDADADKGKSAAADAGAGEPNANIAALDQERERRRRMKDLFSSLQGLMPHLPQKTDKVTLVGEAITYIRELEAKAAMLGRQAAMARQAAGARGESSAAGSSLTATPQTAHGMAALGASADVVPPQGWRGAQVPPEAAAPAPAAMPPAAAMTPVRFRTWTAPNVVLTVANDSAYISVRAPRRANALTMVTSVLNSHDIDVMTVQVSADSVHTMIIVNAHLTATNRGNRSTEEVYQRAVGEIMYRIHSSSNN